MYDLEVRLVERKTKELTAMELVKLLEKITGDKSYRVYCASDDEIRVIGEGHDLAVIYPKDRPHVKFLKQNVDYDIIIED